MSRMIRTVAAVAVAVLLAPAAGTRVAAQAADPWMGTWVLDRGNSTFSGNVPERRSMMFEKVPNGIRHTTETLQAAVTYKLTYVFQVDGKDYPADVQMPLGFVAFKRVNANTLERTGKYLGMVVETVTYQVAGKVMTVTQNGTLNGAEVSSRQVFNRP
jgi:ABC-type glycerol-3-phosphate transport system substrate-binding protein